MCFRDIRSPSSLLPLLCSACRVCSATMAKSVAKGVEAAGAEVKLFQVAETLPQDVLTKVRTDSDT